MREIWESKKPREGGQGIKHRDTKEKIAHGVCKGKNEKRKSAGTF